MDEKEIENLKLRIKLITLNNMYIATISSVYEKMFDEIMSDNCLGSELKESKIKLNDFKRLYLKMIISDFTKGDTDFIRLVDESSQEIVDNMGGIIRKIAEEFLSDIDN